MKSKQQQQRPLNLTITREHARIEELKARLDAITGNQVKVDCSPNCDPVSFERFIEQVISYKLREAALEEAHRDLQLDTLPCPDQLADPMLTDKLWFLIGQLAGQGTYIYHSDHLTDRELYRVLWRQFSGQISPRRTVDHTLRFDVLSGNTDEDTFNYLMYYACDAERARWIEDFPDYNLPPHADPPYERDRHLPRPDW